MRRISLFGLLFFSLTLVACAGGGGGGGSTTTTTTAPPPTPPPSTSTSPFNTTEFQANWGLNAINALYAYDAGLSGAGFVIGVLDTGVDLQQTDLDGNLHPASKDIYDGTSNSLTTLTGGSTVFQSTRTGGASLDDIDGHGTFIAGLVAAEKNGIGSHGLAFDAQVLAVRVDESNSCPTDCTFDDNALAAAINYAVANGADIISLSLGGSPANSYLEKAMSDAIAAGVIFVISAGNAPEENAPYSPDANADPLALEALSAWANGQILIAGASNTLDQIADFSNRAGTGRDFYLLAPGEDLYSTTVNPSNGATTRGIGSGTSFAAPLIAAAAALLMEEFPSLTPSEVVDILLTSATDIGVFGTDAITGHGLLNLEAALAPLGTTAVAIKTESGTILVEGSDSGLIVGGAFGDGFGHGFAEGAIFLDSYDRAYVTRFDTLIRATSPEINFAERFERLRDYEVTSLSFGEGRRLTVAGTHDQKFDAYEQEVLGLSRFDSDAGEVDPVRIQWDSKLGKATTLSLGYGGDLNAFLSGGHDQVLGFETTSLLGEGARAPFSSLEGEGRRFAISHQDRGLTYRLGVAQDEIDGPTAYGLPDMGDEARRVLLLGQMASQDENAGWTLGLGHVSEEGTVLGSFSSGLLQPGRGAETSFVSFAGYRGLGTLGGHVLKVFGQAGFGLTDVLEVPGSAFRRFDALVSSQVALGLGVSDVLTPGGQLSLVVSQPLRVDRGSAVLATATGYDYDTEQALYSDTPRAITPSGRALDFEVSYGFQLGGADLTANLLYQHQPGHRADRDGAVSVMLSGRSRF